MAWTERLPSGRYRGAYRDRHNEKCYVRGTFEQKAEALRKAAAKEEQQRTPGSVRAKAGKITWGAWWEEFMEFHEISPKTERGYRSTVRLHIMPYWEEELLEDIDLVGAMKWVKRLQREPVPAIPDEPPRRGRGKPRSAHTIRTAVQIFAASLNAAVKAHRLSVNPVAGLDWPDLPPGLDRYLTADEFEAIAFHMSSPLNRLILRTAVYTGLRAGEIGGLHTVRVFPDEGLIQVAETLDQEAKFINPVPKDKELRWVPVPPDLMEDIRSHMKTLPDADHCGVEHYRGRCPGGSLVFRGVRGGVFQSNAWARGPFGQALRKAKIQGRVRVHDLRHTYASWLIQAGASLAEVAQVMGHSDTEVTKRYAHLEKKAFTGVRAALALHSERGAARGATGDFAVLRGAMPRQLEDVG